MAISEVARLEMLTGLRTCLGTSVADTLIEHLPPGGWHDIARTSDIESLRRDLQDKLDWLRDDVKLIRIELREDMNNLRIELHQDMTNLREELRGDMNNLREELRGEMSNLRIELKGDMSNLRIELKGDIKELSDRYDTTMKWIIGLVVTNCLGILGTLGTLVMVALR
jgi:hypothetical protein